jgi:hypothetical protein
VGGGGAATDAEAMYGSRRRSASRSSTDAHGTDILTSNQAGPATTLIKSYLAQYAEPS